MAGTTPGGLFRYPYDIATLKPDDPHLLELSDRDRALEDYLAHVGTAASGVFPGVVTVSTPSLGIQPYQTAEPFRSAADFKGDGTNDHLAIQAAINYANPQSGVGCPVLLMPGVYVLHDSIDQKGCTLLGFGDGSIGGGAVLWQQGTNKRVIDNTVSMTNGFCQGFSIIQAAEAAAIYPGAGTVMVIDRVVLDAFAFTHGADYGLIDNSNGVPITVRNCNFQASFQGARGYFGAASATQIIGNNMSGCGITANTGNTFQIVNNYLSFGQVTAGILVENGALYGQINNNMVVGWSDAHGISLDAVYHCQAHNNVVTNVNSSNLYDGINISGVSQDCSIQGNKVRNDIGGGTRYGIRVEAGPSDTLVTNNDLKQSATVASFSDAGTATITAAGNRL